MGGMGTSPQPAVDPALVHGAIARLLNSKRPPMGSGQTKGKKKTQIPPTITRSNGKSERLNI